MTRNQVLRRCRLGVSAAVVTVATLLLTAEPSGAAASAGTTTGTVGSEAAIECKVNVDDPHWSSNFGSVIYKTRVTCVNNNFVRVSGALFYYGSTVASNGESRSVSAGKEATFYTPRFGANKVRADGDFQGATYVSARSGNSVTVYGNTRFVNAP